MERVKEILFQQLDVLMHNMTSEAIKQYAFDDVLALARAIEQTAATYARICELQQMKRVPQENYIPAETVKKRKEMYICDPDKNTECKKQSCKYNPAAVYPVCDRTSNPDFAVLDEFSRPMEAPAKSAYQAMRELDRAGSQNDSACT